MGKRVVEKTVFRENTAENQTMLAINELLQVKVPNDANSTNYYSRVNNVADGRILIAWPTSRGIRLAARVDQFLELSFVREGIPYAFSGLIDESTLEPLPQIWIILTSVIS